MASPPVKNLIEMMSTKPVLAGEPIIRNLSYLEGMDFTRADAAQQKDPQIVFAEIQYSAAEKASAMKYWHQSLQGSKDESRYFSYGLAEDRAAPDTLYTLEVYEKGKFESDVHVKSSANQDLIKHARLQLRGGFVAQH